MIIMIILPHTIGKKMEMWSQQTTKLQERNKRGKQLETCVGFVLAVLAFAPPHKIFTWCGRLPDYLLPGQVVPAACGQVVTGSYYLSRATGIFSLHLLPRPTNHGFGQHLRPRLIHRSD